MYYHHHVDGHGLLTSARLEAGAKIIYIYVSYYVGTCYCCHSIYFRLVTLVLNSLVISTVIGDDRNNSYGNLYNRAYGGYCTANQ
jgi:hypothetical protein